MTTCAAASDVAVVCERGGAEAAAMEAYLRTHDIAAAAWYAPRDIDEVDTALRSGSVTRVIVPRLDVFLAALWDERLTPEAWSAASVRVEFVDPPTGDSAALVPAVVAGWTEWLRRRRRARAVTGLVLSLVAGAVAFVVLWLSR